MSKITPKHQARELPTHITKGEIYRLFGFVAAQTLKAWIDEILRETRGEKYSRNVSILTLKEWVMLLQVTGIPAGFSNIFTDGQSLQEKSEYYR